MYVCYSYNSESTGQNLLKFGGMIGHDPKNYRLVFGSDWVKGQGQGHKKVKNEFGHIEVEGHFGGGMSSPRTCSPCYFM